MQKTPRDSRLPFVLTVLLCLLATVACQSTPEPAEAPARGDVATHSWETPAMAPPATDPAMEEIRRKNQQLSEQVRDLADKLRETREQAPPPAPAPVAPDATPARVGIDAGRLAAAIRQAGISDLEVLSVEGETFVRLPGSLAFRAGSADLMKPARTRLKRLAEVIRATYPDVSLRVEGHTDADPIRKSKWESNHHLSKARAGAVTKYFVLSLGWSDAKVAARGCGAEEPVATNSTREGKAQNRRIEIVLVP